LRRLLDLLAKLAGSRFNLRSIRFGRLPRPQCVERLARAHLQLAHHEQLCRDALDLAIETRTRA